jgi:hypothetical protein
MATVNKDFKIKSGLIVEGTTATVNGYDILTKKPADQTYIIGLIGGAATSENTPDTVVLRDEDGSFSAEVITADGGFVGNVTGTVSDISNHNTDSLTEGSNNLYFSESRAQTGVSNALGSGLGYGSEGAGNVFYVDTNVIATKEFATDEANAAQAAAEQTAANDATTKANNAQSAAEQTAAADATTKADNALAAAEDYADAKINDASSDSDKSWSAYKTSTEIGLAQAAAEEYADGISGDVQDNLDAHTILTSGVHGVTGDVVGTTDAQTISNKTLGSDLAAGGYKVSGLADPTADQDSATKAYVDDAISALVDSAPELLDTLNELAAAINDDASFATTIGNSIGEKVAKAGDSMSGDLDFGGTNKVTSLAAPTSNGDAANKLYVDTEISDLDTAAQGYANTAETDANAYTDGRETAITTAYQSYADTAEADAVTTANAYTDGRETAITIAYEAYADQAEADALADANTYTDGEITTALSTAQGYANTAEQNAKDYADNLDTDDVAEGAAQYFTDARAKASAGDLLAGAETENVVITYTGGVLSITAENGVADSTTDDLVEGSTNKYFSDSLALDAVSGSNIQPESIDITWVRRENATWTDVPTASQVVCHQAGASEGSMKYLVRVTASVGGTRHSHVTEVLATVDGSNGVAVVEYGTIYTSAEPMATVTVLWNGLTNCYELNVTTANNNSEVMVAATMLAVLD